MKLCELSKKKKEIVSQVFFQLIELNALMYTMKLL